MANLLKRKIVEASFVKLITPSFNEQLDDDVFILFRNGATRQYIFK